MKDTRALKKIFFLSNLFLFLKEEKEKGGLFERWRPISVQKMTQIERDTLDHEESERENDACQRHSTHPDKDVLKTTSPIFVPSAPNAFPCHTEPSSKTNLQGFWTSHGFEIAAKHRTPALPLLFDDDDDEVEVEHEALFFKDVLPTRPLNCVDTKLAWWWWCAEQDDIAKARLFYVFFFCSKSSFEMTRRRRVNIP